MTVRITGRRVPLTNAPRRCSHILVVATPDQPWPEAPGRVEVQTALRRAGGPDAPWRTPPVVVQLASGQLVSWVRVDPAAAAFERHTALRKALAPLLAERPTALDISVHCADEARGSLASDAVLVTLHNSQPLPTWKRGAAPAPLGSVTVHGAPTGSRFATEQALADGNRLCRELTSMPPNMLTPTTYRRRLRELAAAEGWQRSEFDTRRLTRLGAGAFMAVARGSHQADAAIVHLTYDGRPQRSGRRVGRTVALVGKGICFDTGGHNLKKDTSMNTMHTDMNGSAVAVGALLAVSRLGLPVRVDVWLAIAQNHLSPEAYTQNEVVTALDGTTIEIAHTDAEGRMVLADTLALASRAKPDEIIDFATLTGSMVSALGTRQSGVMSNREHFAARAVAAGAVTGERVVAFPLPDDYDEALESTVADVKQCVLESGAADHLLAGRLLQRFVNDVPWLHVDLSSSMHRGGLGAVGTEINGFGVALALELVSSPSAPR